MWHVEGAASITDFIGKNTTENGGGGVDMGG